VELEQQRAQYVARGINVASISYDRTAVLKNFAERKGIHYPMLSDPDSKIIRAFGILNEAAPKGTPAYGIPHPGTYIVDENGIVKAKYFEDDFRDRYTASNILWRQFGASGPVQAVAETPQLRMELIASDPVVRPGARIALELQIELKPGMHVYAPGVEGGYIPVDWWIEKSKGWQLHDMTWPLSKKLYLAPIHETVPVYENNFRLRRDLTIGQQADIAPLLDAERKLTVEGAFSYQACDAKECFPPRTIPLQFRVKVAPLDRERAPAEMQRK
jgi:hypothetical protein